MQHITDEHYIYEHAESNAPAAHAKDGEVVIFDTRDCYNRLVQRWEMSRTIRPRVRCMWMGRSPATCWPLIFSKLM